MRVLVVTNMFPTEKNPTSGIQVKLQAESLKKQGMEIDIIFMNVRESRLKLNYIKGVWQVFWKTLLNRYDVIHAYFGLSGLVARFQFRAPIVVSFTGGDVMHIHVRKLSKIVSRIVDASIVKSDRMKEHLGNKDVHMIPNGVDFKLFKPLPMNEARKYLGLSNSRKYILFVGGKYGKVKRFDLIEGAFSIVKEKFEGEVELISIYKRAQDEIPLYMNACNVLVLASDWEGSPNVIKEAMACNMPIVTVDVGDVRDVINGAKNCYISKRDKFSIADGLAKALRNKDRTDGRKRITHLSSENVTKKIINIYNSVLDKGIS